MFGCMCSMVLNLTTTLCKLEMKLSSKLGCVGNFASGAGQSLQIDRQSITYELNRTNQVRPINEVYDTGKSPVNYIGPTRLG